MCECDDDNFEPLTNIEVEQLLSKIKLTAAGCDGLPACYYVAALMSLLILLHILNCSFSTGKFPSYWLTALVTPVPKVSALRMRLSFNLLNV